MRLKKIEEAINSIEKVLPPITTFLLSGGTELSALLDFSRTLARKAERNVVLVSEQRKSSLDRQTLVYLNRLSSLLYAMTRLSNAKSGIKEEPPHY